jgi:Protein of unknown function (DUF2442)
MPTLSPNTTDNRAAQVHFSDARLFVLLADGRELSVPLSWFPRLLAATPAQRDHWELIGEGTGIHWPDVDEDISVPRLLGLPCE